MVGSAEERLPPNSSRPEAEEEGSSSHTMKEDYLLKEKSQPSTSAPEADAIKEPSLFAPEQEDLSRTDPSRK